MDISFNQRDRGGADQHGDDNADVRNIPLELRELADSGIRASFSVLPGGRVACSVCFARVRAAEVEMLEVRRLEGSSDPDAEAVVLGLRCPSCGARGSAVLGYGPTASAEDQDVLLALRYRPRSGDEWPLP